MTYQPDFRKFETIQYNNETYIFTFQQIFRTIYLAKKLFNLPFLIEFDKNIYYQMESQYERDVYLAKFVTEKLFNQFKETLKRQLMKNQIDKMFVCSLVIFDQIRLQIPPAYPAVCFLDKAHNQVLAFNIKNLSYITCFALTLDEKDNLSVLLMICRDHL